MIWISVGVLLFLQWEPSLSICGSFQGTTCCSGTFWNKEKSICEKCPLGYHSLNCSEVCKFPNFGNDCQGICNCSVSVCDHRFGCKDFIGIHNDGTTYLATVTSGRITKKNLKKSTDITSFGERPNSEGLPNAIVYIIIALVCGFMILFGLFVGVYFYKHCIKPTTQLDGKKIHSFNSVEGYKSLTQPENNQAFEHPHGSLYLEPISEPNVHYNEILNKEEMVEEGISDVYVEKQNEEIVILSPRSSSCHFLVHVANNVKTCSDEIIQCTNSL